MFCLLLMFSLFAALIDQRWIDLGLGLGWTWWVERLALGRQGRLGVCLGLTYSW